MSLSFDPSVTDDSTLIRLALAGSRAAFEGLVRAHHGAVRWQLLRTLRDAAAADDLAQEVFLHAFRHLDRFRGDESIRPWLIGIARNKAKEFVRAEVRRKGREQGPLAMLLARWRAERLEEGTDEAEEYERNLARLRDCIGALAPRSRQVIEEHYFRSRTLESLGQTWGCTGGALRMLLLRIRKTLGECLQRGPDKARTHR
ncbi:MAG TPA: hypothetical protein DCQ98_20440 [Planctomycetaceae bacterium]|nr:hypothetical protein [Planctomycetaceae bacterium]